MRALAALIVFATLRADARPRRVDFDDDYYKPPPACPRTNNWTKLQSCEFKGAKTIHLLRNLASAKLVSWAPKGYGEGASRLELYVLANGAWVKSGFYAETNVSSELLGFEAMANDVYRLEMGYATATWVSVDDVSTRPALLRRRYTYYCSVKQGCRSAISTCEVLVHGKAVATFRGEVKWTATNQLEIHGDGRSTNRYCTRPPNLIEASE